MDQRTIATPDGITVYLATGATLWHPSETTPNASESITNIAAAAAHPLTEHGLPTRGWDYEEHRPWTWRTTSPTEPLVVAGFDPDDEHGVDAAIEYIARHARLDRARADATRAQAERERQNARAAAERIAARRAPIGYERERAYRQRDAFVDTLVRRGILDREEITEICELIGRVPDFDHYGAEELPLYYGPADVAAARGVKRGTVDRYIAEGRLPLPDVTSSSTQLWRAETIERWLRQDIERR